MTGRAIKITAGGLKGYLAADYDAADFREFLKDPDRAFEDADEILKDSPTTKAAFITADVNGVPRRFHLKRINNKGFAYTIRNLAKKSRALVTFRNARKLLSLGVPTPIPVAALEERKAGMLKRGFFITERAEGAVQFYDWLSANFRKSPQHEKTGITKALAELVRAMHISGVRHGDLKCSNALIIPKLRPTKILITDLDAARFSRGGWNCKAAAAEIARLALSVYDTIDATDRKQFLKFYFDAKCDAEGWGDVDNFRKRAAREMRKHLAGQKRKEKYPQEYFDYFETGAGKCPSD